jgi:benzoyl-CoA 2,3-dioxygenase component B
MFVGEMGVARVVARTCELMKEHPGAKVEEYGGIGLELLQKYLNFHYSVSLDLFGSELSTNAANYFTAGLKGRFRETERRDDHRLKNQQRKIARCISGQIVEEQQPALIAINEMLRDDYVADSARGVARWNKIISGAGIDFELKLPHRGFNRAIGEYANVKVTPAGATVANEEWEVGAAQWLPSETERALVASLMKPAIKPGEYARWLTPPARGINHQPLDFAYVKFNA